MAGSIYEAYKLDEYEDVKGGTPWGRPDVNLEPGDYVNIVHSDHRDYIFDNPAGFVVKSGDESVTVVVEVEVPRDLLLLVARRKVKEARP